MSEAYITALIILGFIALVLLIIALLYSIIVSRRKNITLKKADYLIEDITYKSEILSSTVESVSKIANYVDVFEVVARKNIKSLAKLSARNKDEIYKVLERLRRLLVGEKDESSKPKGTKSESQKSKPTSQKKVIKKGGSKNA